MKEFEIIIDKISNIPIQVGKTFSTALLTLSGAAYNELDVPANAAEVLLESSQEFTLGETNSAVGFKTDRIERGIASMTKIYIKGTDAQEIKVIWTLL